MNNEQRLQLLHGCKQIAIALNLSRDEVLDALLEHKNINDDDHLVGMYLTDPSSGLFTNVFAIEPRTYGLALGYNFN